MPAGARLRIRTRWPMAQGMRKAPKKVTAMRSIERSALARIISRAKTGISIRVRKATVPWLSASGPRRVPLRKSDKKRSSPTVMPMIIWLEYFPCRAAGNIPAGKERPRRT